MKHVAVILAGCGVFDGTEINEACAVLVHLSRAGAEVRTVRKRPSGVPGFTRITLAHMQNDGCTNTHIHIDAHMQTPVQLQTLLCNQMRSCCKFRSRHTIRFLGSHSVNF